MFLALGGVLAAGEVPCIGYGEESTSEKVVVGGVQNLPILAPKSGDFGLLQTYPEIMDVGFNGMLSKLSNTRN